MALARRSSERGWNEARRVPCSGSSDGCALGVLLIGVSAGSGFAQKALTWQEVRDKFEAANPTLRAGQIGIDESRAQEITANLRPNPNLTILADQIDPFSGGPPHGPFAYLLSSGSVNYLWERQHKRGLRLESAQKGDCSRNLQASRPGAKSVIQPPRGVRRRRFRKRRSSIWPKKIWPITTMCWT